MERRRCVLLVTYDERSADDRLLLNPNWLLDPRLSARQMIWRLTMMSWRMTISCNPHVFSALSGSFSLLQVDETDMYTSIYLYTTVGPALVILLITLVPCATFDLSGCLSDS